MAVHERCSGATVVTEIVLPEISLPQPEGNMSHGRILNGEARLFRSDVVGNSTGTAAALRFRSTASQIAVNPVDRAVADSQEILKAQVPVCHERKRKHIRCEDGKSLPSCCLSSVSCAGHWSS